MKFAVAEVTTPGALGTSNNFDAGTPATLDQTAVINAINADSVNTGVTAVADSTTGFTLSSTEGNVLQLCRKFSKQATARFW